MPLAPCSSADLIVYSPDGEVCGLTGRRPLAISSTVTAPIAIDGICAPPPDDDVELALWDLDADNTAGTDEGTCSLYGEGWWSPDIQHLTAAEPYAAALPDCGSLLSLPTRHPLAWKACAVQTPGLNAGKYVPRALGTTAAWSFVLY